jgi:hypothetical protein
MAVSPSVGGQLSASFVGAAGQDLMRMGGPGNGAGVAGPEPILFSATSMLYDILALPWYSCFNNHHMFLTA